MSNEQVTNEEMLRRYESFVAKSQENEVKSQDDRRRYEVLIEKYRDDHKMLGEGYASLNERIDRLDQKVDQKFGELSFRVDSVAATVTKMDSRLQKVEHHLGLNGSGKKPATQRSRPKKSSPRK